MRYIGTAGYSAQGNGDWQFVIVADANSTKEIEELFIKNPQIGEFYKPSIKVYEFDSSTAAEILLKYFTDGVIKELDATCVTLVFSFHYNWST